jgi:hypothetical protein
VPVTDTTSARAGLSTGGLVGFNLALAGAAVTSQFWNPSWNQLAWMWGGFSIGEAAATLVFPIYAATGGDPRHGLIFMGVAGTAGAVAGAFIGHPDRGQMNHASQEEEWHKRFLRVRGGGLMPVVGGAGATLNGELW